MPKCGECHADKPSSEFYPRSDRPGSFRSTCRACYNRATDDRRVKRLARLAGRERPTHCEVCGSDAGHGKGLSWDHDHTTGRFRGWLCHPCNLILGQCKDSPQRLRALAEYLERST